MDSGSDSEDFETSGEEDLEPRRMEAGFQGANGFFIDFVSRKTKSRHPLLVMLLGDARSRQRMARRASQSEAGIKMLQSYKDAKALINFERLEWNLLNLLTNFWKKLQHPSWATPPDVLQQIVRRIHMQHQMESCVQAELEEHILELHKAKSDALRQAMAAKREDDDSDESVRRQGFWHTFHRGTRKGEPRPVTPAKTELYLPALNGAGWVQPRSRGNSSIEEVEIHRQDGGKNATLSGKARNRLEVSKLPQRGAGISKSAPDLKRAHKFGAANHASGLLPSIGPRLQKAAAADQDRCRFTPPNSKRGDSKMWWFQSGLEEHRDYIQREEVASKRHSRRNLLGHVKEPPMPPTSFGSHCPIFHLGPCPIDSPGAEPRRSAALLPPIEVVVPVHEQLGRQEVAAASRQYIHACQREQVVPVPSTFVTGHSRKVDAAGKAVVDSDLLTLCAVGRLTEVEDVDLSGGKLLSDVAMGTFLQDVLLAPQNLGTLQRLSLSECVHAARQSQAALVRLLQEGGASRLHFLDLSGVSLAMRHLGPFCQAVEKHPALQTLRLCNAGLGGAMDVRNCLRRILSGRIQVLDFGWNCLLAEELKFLGELVSRNKNLRQLGLANCAASSQKNSSISPCVYFLEQLVHGVSLTNLDISMNRIDFRGALVIEDALERSRRLSTLNVSHNPLGVMGLRCLLRLLARQDSGLVAIDMENCFSGELRPSVEGIQVFTYTNPGGHYSLDLTRPYHRSLLRTLYKVGQHLKLNPVDTFHVISYDSGHFTLASQPDAGVWPVPSSGHLEVGFSIEKAMEQAVKGVAVDNFSEILARYNEVMRFTPHFRKLIPLLAQWRLLEGQEQEQLAMLSALGRDFIFTATHLRQLCSCKAIAGVTVARLLPTLLGGRFAMNMVMRRVENLSEFIKMLTLCKEYLLFNPQSPSGHYKLDLSNTASAYVAQALALLDRWESGLAKRKELPDISENGDYSCIRNCLYAHEPLLSRSYTLQRFDQWVIPEKEVLELDYVSNHRPDCHGALMNDSTFKKFLIILQQAECDGPTQIQVTRNIAHHINLSSMQMRQILGVYRTSELREEALITTFFRIVDIHNEKIFRVRYEEQAELDKLRSRLGYCTFFTYIQPEQVTNDFDFAKYDQRLAANIFFNLANAEKRDNISNFRYTLPDGTIDKLEQGVPRSWDQFSRMPKEGSFHFTYKCSPQDRKFALRKSLLQQYGKWKVDVAEEQVMWWAAAAEAPEDVLEFLFWMRAKFRDTHQAFEAFDGADGNGVIGLREFEEGMRLLKCQKFRGKDEKQRWTAIFRFLDPSGEGQVSKEEFLTLDDFWTEVEFSIREFMDWADRKFGRDLKRLWRALDEDGGGTIQRDEWETMLDRVGYFGPSGPIFSFIDEDDGGEISWHEFQTLRQFQKPKE
ncbi:unnamed protein product [Effrenium voratum]|nr:unnamed protein product [Effrenium voratum]